MFKKCNEETAKKMNITCKNEAEINKFFKENYFFIFYSDNSVNSNDNIDPIYV